MNRGRAGVDLHLASLRARTARELEYLIRDAVDRGSLSRGARLPSARQLAQDIGLSKNTVASVYAALSAEGVLRSEVGAGTWVNEWDTPSSEQTADRAFRPRLDLRAGMVDASDFPMTKWGDAVRQALRDSDAIAGYAPASGDPMLRSELARYLGRTRGCVIEDSVVLTGHGFGELLALAAKALVARGIDAIAVEEYGHQSHREILMAAGLRLIPLPVDEWGAQVESLEESGVRAVLLTPAHQFPTGFALSDDRRKFLSTWVGRVDGIILEDDYDGEFRYDRRSIGALQALAPEGVIYLGTASKALSPALGVAWALAPSAWAEEMASHRSYTGSAPSGLHERALAWFIAAHEYDRAVRRRRAVFRARRETLATLMMRAPGCRIEGHLAGLHCIVTLPDDAPRSTPDDGRGGSPASRVADSARHAGIAINTLGEMHIAGSGQELVGPPYFHDALVVGFGAPRPGAADAAIHRLVGVIQGFLRTE